MAISTLPLANRIKRKFAVVACDCCCCCRIDEQVNWEMIFKSNISDGGTGGGGTRNWGGAGRRDIVGTIPKWLKQESIYSWNQTRYTVLFPKCDLFIIDFSLIWYGQPINNTFMVWTNPSITQEWTTAGRGNSNHWTRHFSSNFFSIK